MNISDKIQTAIRTHVENESRRIIHEETEAAINRVRRRLADSVAKITSQISCQLIPEGDSYKIEVTLPGSGVLKMQEEGALPSNLRGDGE